MNNMRWEDLVFANRNQAYGAYPLRRTYTNRVSLSFAFAMTVTAMMLSYPVIKSLFGTESAVRQEKKKVDYNFLEQQPIIERIPVVPPPQPRVPVEQIRYVPPRVTQEQVADVPPTIDELRNVDVSDQDVDGAEIIETPVVADLPPVIEDDPEKVWVNVQQQPEFPGGFAEMMKFIGKNIRYPASARRMGIAGNVFISFVVNPDGSIDNIETIKGVYADIDKEAMRVIAKMPTWKPGKQNGKAVKVKFVLPIKFTLSN